MYFITPSDPGITLIGIYETQIYGFGEKNNKLCIYTKSIFDVGKWKEFYLTDIAVVKSDCCDIGLHVAGGICSVDQVKTIGVIKQPAIWIAAREKEFTHIISINIVTKKFIRYKMLEKLYPEFKLLNLNLCCKCVKPIIHFHYSLSNFISLVIAPQIYQKNVGIFQVRVSINPSNYCLLWKKMESFTLNSPPLASLSNIFMSVEGEVFSVTGRSEEDGRVHTFSKESEVSQDDIYFPDDDDINWIWHEVAFSSFNGLCLTRRRKEDDGKSILRLNAILFSDIDTFIGFILLDYCTVDANFPSIDSTQFFISYRIVDKEYVYKTPSKTIFALTQLYAIPSFIAFQTSDGSSIVVISFQVLSLSQSAYLSLARIPHPSQHRLLPVVQITCIDYFFQRIRDLLQFSRTKENVSKKEEKDEPWMSQEFIKQKVRWPKILPLTNAPKFYLLDYCTLDANFSSLESVHFYVTFRYVDKEFVAKRGNGICFGAKYAIPSYIYFQLADGSTVTIPLEILSLSQLAYLSLACFSQSSQAHHSSPIAVISCIHYYFQRIRNFCGSSKENISKKKNGDDVWISQEFIKKKIGWPKIFPLIKAPVLHRKSK